MFMDMISIDHVLDIQGDQKQDNLVSLSNLTFSNVSLAMKNSSIFFISKGIFEINISSIAISNSKSVGNLLFFSFLNGSIYFFDQLVFEKNSIQGSIVNFLQISSNIKVDSSLIFNQNLAGGNFFYFFFNCKINKRFNDIDLRISKCCHFVQQLIKFHRKFWT